MQLLKPWAFVIHPELRQVWQNAFQLNLTLGLSLFLCVTVTSECKVVRFLKCMNFNNNIHSSLPLYPVQKIGSLWQCTLLKIQRDSCKNIFSEQVHLDIHQHSNIRRRKRKGKSNRPKNNPKTPQNPSFCVRHWHTPSWASHSSFHFL